jgi:PhnB protein
MTKRSSAELEIRAVIESRAKALRAKDVEGVFAHQAADAVLFTMAPPLQYAGMRAFDRDGVQEWFDSFTGKIGYEIRELQIQAGAGVAFSHCLNHMTGERTDGEKTDLWFRHTLGFRKLRGAWKVVHEHESVPFYMDGSGRAALDLEP